MALWQYSFQILPQKSFRILNKNSEFFDENNLFDDELYWMYEPINKVYFEGIGQILAKGKSWSKEISLFGDEKSNCLEILFDTQTNNIRSVSLRIDFTSEFEVILRGIVDFCIYNELVLLDEELLAIPLNYESIVCVINSSSQFKKYNKLREQSSE
jgi:hypothetical protein